MPIQKWLDNDDAMTEELLREKVVALTRQEYEKKEQMIYEEKQKEIMRRKYKKNKMEDIKQNYEMQNIRDEFIDSEISVYDYIYEIVKSYEEIKSKQRTEQQPC